MCNFDFNLPVDAEPLVALASEAIHEHGGSTETRPGHIFFTIPTLAGPIDGTCKVVAQKVINIRVTDKPNVVSCDLIRKQLVTHLTKAVRVYTQTSSTT